MTTENKTMDLAEEGVIRRLSYGKMSNLREAAVLGALANPNDVATITFDLRLIIDRKGKFKLEYGNLMDIIRRHVLANDGHTTYQDRYLNAVKVLLKDAAERQVDASFSSRNAELYKVGDTMEPVYLGLISSSPDFNEPTFEYENMESEEQGLGVKFKIDEDLTIHVIDDDDGKGFNRLDYVGLVITDLTILIREW